MTGKAVVACKSRQHTRVTTDSCEAEQGITTDKAKATKDTFTGLRLDNNITLVCRKRSMQSALDGGVNRGRHYAFDACASVSASNICRWACNIDTARRAAEEGSVCVCVSART